MTAEIATHNEPDQFRHYVREWLEQNCPEEMRTPIRKEADICWGGRQWTFKSEAQQQWLQRMAAQGWTTPSWPQAYGGGGLDQVGVKILKQEMKRIGARSPLESFGISMLGPALLKYGSEAQKQAFLPPIVRGEIRWCQGYSEPNAGSDLASLQTKSEDMAKVWTSYADQADWMFCLVRTNADGSKHQGISFVLFDMESPGVSTKPIKLISGKSPFCETHLENVKVPKDQLMGELNQGWAIAKYLLTHEREMISKSGMTRGMGKPLGQAALKTIGSENGQLADPLLRADIARFEIDELAFGLTIERAHDEVKAGVSFGAASSMFKYYGTELNKTRYELLMDIAGDGLDPEDGDLCRNWLRTKANSIEGGTSEIQLNIVAKRILGLPT